jgi:hypothetical protein
MSFSGRQHLQCLAHKLRLWSSDGPSVASGPPVLSQPACVTTNETLFEVCTFVPNTWTQILELPSLLCVRTGLSSVFAMRNHHFEGLSSKRMIRTVILFAGDSWTDANRNGLLDRRDHR